MVCGNCGRPRGEGSWVCACVPGWVWRDPEMAAAVRERDAQAVIRFLRRRVKSLSQEALARMCGVAQSTITRAESGRGLTDRRKAMEALRGLGAPLSADEPSPGDRREKKTPTPLRPFTPTAGSDSAPSAPVPAPRVPVVPQPLWPQVTEGSETEAVQAFRLADRQVGGGHLYAAVMHYLSTRVGPALVAETSTSTTFVAAAGLTEMAGWMAHDAGRDDVAARHFRRALNLARAGEADALIAQVWASRAHLALHDNDPDAALVAAEQAWGYLDGSEDAALRGRVLAMRTRAHAVHGDAAASRAALVQAERLLSAPVPPPASEWTSPFDLGSLAGEAARSMCDLDDHTAAAEHARHALQLRTPDRARARALASLTLAHALVGQGNVEEAAAVTRDVAGTAAAVGSLVVSGHIRRVAEALTPYRATPAIATVLDEVSSVLARHRGMYHWLGQGT